MILILDILFLFVVKDPKKRPKVDLVVFQEKPLSERPKVKKSSKTIESSNGVKSHSANSVNGSTNGKALKETDNVSFFLQLSILIYLKLHIFI